MNTNLIFKLSKDSITISKIKEVTDIEELNNTNIIDTKTLKFSSSYIKENLDLVASFLNVIILKNNIKVVQISNNDIALIALDLINYWDQINKIIFKENLIVNLEIVIKLLSNKNINEIDCYEMTDTLIQRLDLNRKLKVHTRHKIDYKSKFMIENFLNSYTDIYYKKAILISSESNEIEIEDIKTFFNINDKLKQIKLINFTNEIFTTIIEELKKYDKKNISIIIYEKNNDINTINKTVSYINKKYKKFLENNKIFFKYQYSIEYKRRNFIKELNLKIISFIILGVIGISLLALGFNSYKRNIDNEKTLSSIDQVNEILEQFQDEIIENNIDDIIEEPTTNIVDDTQTTTTKTTKKSKPSVYYTNFTKVFSELEKINSDTVGWITINNTKINYPVVQYSNNSYYLNHDFNKKRNGNGWIYMDYRNNIKDLDKNTIIYGHTLESSNIMMSTLKYMFNSSWYKKSSNQIITFNTKEKDMKWQIFSIYRIASTEDYLVNKFESDEEFMEYINMVKKRSIYNFNVEIKPTDKILTLSTCSDNGTKRAVHAVLIEE